MNSMVNTDRLFTSIMSLLDYTIYAGMLDDQIDTYFSKFECT